jgi:hypothetical protein
MAQDTFRASNFLSLAPLRPFDVAQGMLCASHLFPAPKGKYIKIQIFLARFCNGDKHKTRTSREEFLGLHSNKIKNRY